MSQATNTVPLTMNEAGVLRVTGTRVSLDSVIYAFNEGATPEEIIYRYPTLELKDVYVVIGYYLNNREEVEQYLTRSRAEDEELRKELEKRFNPNGIRERLLARRPS